VLGLGYFRKEGREVHLQPEDNGPIVIVNDKLVEDGLEAFAEASLKHSDASFRDTARKIQREQFSKIKLSQDIVSSIIQHGAFGEELF
jgi:hypothetical protein